MIQMIRQVSFIEEFNTTMGHVVTVNTKDVFHVGEVIENKGKRYLIKGFPMVSKATPGITSIVVAEV